MERTDGHRATEEGITGTSRPSRLGVYGISVAAELSGVDPQSMRLYERRGLLNPARTSGGTRRYSDDDLVRLRHISELSGAGINLAGIAHIFRLRSDYRQLAEEHSRLTVENARLASELARLRAESAAIRPAGPNTAVPRNGRVPGHSG